MPETPPPSAPTGGGRPAPENATPPGWSAESTRSLDRRYLNRNPTTSHRPYFGFVASRAQALLGTPSARVLDIGCANGSFVHYLLEHHPQISCTGIDVLPELVEDAVRNVPAATFLVGDIRQRESLPDRSFPLVTMLTLHSHFDDLAAILDNVMSVVEAGGRALIFGSFNHTDADVLVRIRDGGQGGDWLPGWNLHSRTSVSDLLRSRGFTFTFHDYEPPPNWADRSGDPLGTRRVEIDGRPSFRNDAGLILPFALLEVRS
ncbi:MAG: class I SAM-dependent methyltransferase [Dermatophilaceae bacterium]